jgi:hypothetical protein
VYALIAVLEKRISQNENLLLLQLQQQQQLLLLQQLIIILLLLIIIIIIIHIIIIRRRRIIKIIIIIIIIVNEKKQYAWSHRVDYLFWSPAAIFTIAGKKKLEFSCPVIVSIIVLLVV